MRFSSFEPTWYYENEKNTSRAFTAVLLSFTPHIIWHGYFKLKKNKSNIYKSEAKGGVWGWAKRPENFRLSRK